MSSFRHALYRSFWLSTVYCLSILQCSLCQTLNGTNSNPRLSFTAPALFALGDSLIDTGNNNNLTFTFIKANFPPYGKNFDDKKATGRFCDGRLTIDFFAEALGIKKNVPAYLDPHLQQEDLLTGVSFGSAGTGFDPQTSTIGLVRPMTEQLKMVRRYRKTVTSIIGRERTEFLFRESIFIIAAGNCDLLNTYFTMPFRRLKYNHDTYTSLMMKYATRFLQRLYKLGARKIGITNLPPLGLTPIARTFGGGLKRKVPEHYNEATRKFNTKLKLEVQYLNSQLANVTIVLFDVYNIVQDIVDNREQYGFEIDDVGCCGVGMVEVGPFCNVFSPVKDVSKCIFWDSFHPTEGVYNITATRIINTYFPQFFKSNSSCLE